MSDVTPETKLALKAVHDNLLRYSLSHLRESAEAGKLPNLARWKRKENFLKRLQEVGGPEAIGCSLQEFNGLVEISQLSQGEAQITGYKGLQKEIKAVKSLQPLLDKALETLETGNGFSLFCLEMFQDRREKQSLSLEHFTIANRRTGIKRPITEIDIKNLCFVARTKKNDRLPRNTRAAPRVLADFMP